MSTIITKENCPDYTDASTTVHLPQIENLVFTKQ